MDGHYLEILLLFCKFLNTADWTIAILLALYNS